MENEKRKSFNPKSPLFDEQIKEQNKTLRSLHTQLLMIKQYLDQLKAKDKAKKVAKEKGEVFNEALFEFKLRELVDINEIKKIKISNYLMNQGVKMVSDSGNRKKCCCPLHKEKSPSFVVYEDNNSWYCFGGCGKGGSIIDLVIALENTDVSGAIRILQGCV